MLLKKTLKKILGVDVVVLAAACVVCLVCKVGVDKPWKDFVGNAALVICIFSAAIMICTGVAILKKGKVQKFVESQIDYRDGVEPPKEQGAPKNPADEEVSGDSSHTAQKPRTNKFVVEQVIEVGDDGRGLS